MSFIGKHYLEQPSFLPLLYTVLRERCDHYYAGQPVSVHSEISDRQILVACRWVHWVHSQLQQDPKRADSAGRDLADRFAREELPELLSSGVFWMPIALLYRTGLSHNKRLRHPPMAESLIVG